jgi:hypothetical protein
MVCIPYLPNNLIYDHEIGKIEAEPYIAAETAALLVLKKKVDAIWGNDEGNLQ